MLIFFIIILSLVILRVHKHQDHSLFMITFIVTKNPYPQDTIIMDTDIGNNPLA